MSEDDKPWANLGFQEAQAVYESPSQNARVWTESWVACSMFCPNCGRADISQYAANRPVADFACQTCHEDYELKSKKGRFGTKIVDGAYGAMMTRLAASDNPNLICMAYDLNRKSVTDLFVVPKQVFTSDLIEARPPLRPHARRAGWTGCNIRLDRVPASGRVFVVREGALLAKRDVQAQWASTLFLRGRGEAARGWLIEVMRCVEALGRAAFTHRTTCTASRRSWRRSTPATATSGPRSGSSCRSCATRATSSSSAEAATGSRRRIDGAKCSPYVHIRAALPSVAMSLSGDWLGRRGEGVRAARGVGAFAPGLPDVSRELVPRSPAVGLRWAVKPSQGPAGLRGRFRRVSLGRLRRLTGIAPEVQPGGATAVRWLATSMKALVSAREQRTLAQ